MSVAFRMASLVVVLLATAPLAAHADDWSEAELKRLEGQFELTYKNAAGTTFKIVRDVLGDVEVVTHYDDAGHVVNAHRASIKVEKRGAVCVFSFFNAVVTAGPNKGATQLETNSYVYRFANDTFVEAWGLLENDPNPPRMNVWRRVKSP